MVVIMKVNHTRKFAHSHMRPMLCVMVSIHTLTKIVIHTRVITFFTSFFFFLVFLVCVFHVIGKNGKIRPILSSPCYVTWSYLVFFDGFT